MRDGKKEKSHFATNEIEKNHFPNNIVALNNTKLYQEFYSLCSHAKYIQYLYTYWNTYTYIRSRIP